MRGPVSRIDARGWSDRNGRMGQWSAKITAPLGKWFNVACTRGGLTFSTWGFSCRMRLAEDKLKAWPPACFFFSPKEIPLLFISWKKCFHLSSSFFLLVVSFWLKKKKGDDSASCWWPHGVGLQPSVPKKPHREELTQPKKRNHNHRHQFGEGDNIVGRRLWPGETRNDSNKQMIASWRHDNHGRQQWNVVTSFCFVFYSSLPSLSAFILAVTLIVSHGREFRERESETQSEMLIRWRMPRSWSAAFLWFVHNGFSGGKLIGRGAMWQIRPATKPQKKRAEWKMSCRCREAERLAPVHCKWSSGAIETSVKRLAEGWRGLVAAWETSAWLTHAWPSTTHTVEMCTGGRPWLSCGVDLGDTLSIGRFPSLRRGTLRNCKPSRQCATGRG